MSSDRETAAAFALSWNSLPPGSIYTKEQFEDWLAPLKKKDIIGRTVLELGCGNGSLMLHLLDWNPQSLHGVDLGDSVRSAKENILLKEHSNCSVEKADLTDYRSNGYDLVYSIGVLHHLNRPEDGFQAVVRNVKLGGKFHCWVYAKEGNKFVYCIVDPIRRLASKLPWWMTRYLVADPLSFLFFVYVQIVLRSLPRRLAQKTPLFQYCQWIKVREYGFFRHVVLDQIITPQTVYIEKKTIESWLSSHKRIDQRSTYIVQRNSNSWKFGGIAN